MTSSTTSTESVTTHSLADILERSALSHATANDATMSERSVSAYHGTAGSSA